MLVWPWLFLDGVSSCIWITRTSSSQFHYNLVLDLPRKPYDPVMDIYDSQTCGLKTRVEILMTIHVVQLEYGIFAQKFHLKMWFFQLINGITLVWDYVMWHIVDLLVYIRLWTKLSIYRVPPDPVKCSFQGFSYLWWTFIMIWMLTSKNLSLSCRNQCYAPSDARIAASLMDFECQTCGFFECL